MPLLEEAFVRWVYRGVALMLRHGNDGLESFLSEVRSWLDRLRKKGGQVWCRHFINMFAYEAKVSFYTCYANAWVGLTPWLKQNRGLDELSERFLRRLAQPEPADRDSSRSVRAADCLIRLMVGRPSWRLHSTAVRHASPSPGRLSTLGPLTSPTSLPVRCSVCTRCRGFS